MLFIILWKIAGAPPPPPSQMALPWIGIFREVSQKLFLVSTILLLVLASSLWLDPRSSGILLLPGYQSSPLSSALERGLDGSLHWSSYNLHRSLSTHPSLSPARWGRPMHWCLAQSGHPWASVVSLSGPFLSFHGVAGMAESGLVRPPPSVSQWQLLVSCLVGLWTCFWVLPATASTVSSDLPPSLDWYVFLLNR